MKLSEIETEVKLAYDHVERTRSILSNLLLDMDAGDIQ